MYKWYEGADICYAYLSDVATGDIDFHGMYDGAMSQSFKASKWFTRGWTLQELIAPRSVEFYAKDWTNLGTKSYHREEISAITGINVYVLDGGDPSISNVAERLSWAASRQTTRIEDAAYCLLGIFRVHMPLLYGEGERALIRLQEEILKTTEDYTFLARGRLDDYSYLNHWTRAQYDIHAALASQLQEFRISRWSDWKYSDLLNTTHTTLLPSEGQVADIPPTLTAKGLHICLPVLKLSDNEYLVYLYCKLFKSNELMCMPLMPVFEHLRENCFVRKRGGDPFGFVRLMTMFIQQTPHYPHVDTLNLHSRHFSVAAFEVSTTAGSAVSQNCMVMASWGSNTKSLPWKMVIEDGANSYSFQLSALVVLT
jgi:hypothetical protein